MRAVIDKISAAALLYKIHIFFESPVSEQKKSAIIFFCLFLSPSFFRSRLSSYPVSKSNGRAAAKSVHSALEMKVCVNESFATNEVNPQSRSLHVQ